MATRKRRDRDEPITNDLKLYGPSGATWPAPTDVLTFRLGGPYRGVLTLEFLSPLEWWRLTDQERNCQHQYFERFGLYVARRFVPDEEAPP